MNLSKYNLRHINAKAVSLPEEELFELPERVLQFGTGRLLRGLPDYFIDKANRKGIFNGRIVIVKTTEKGDLDVFEKQDGLYTICERGIESGKLIESNIISASISRVLTAKGEWEKVLQCAYNKHLNVVISNTTEIGIRLVNDDIRRYPPVSFPGKLLSFLYERFTAFGGTAESGLVIVPTELIPDNGKKLESIVLELAHLNGLEAEFIEWLEESNYFCNSIVDRITTGMPDENIREKIEKELGYKDDLLTISEVYKLWAIEGDKHIKDVLSFNTVDKGLIIEENIELHRELKLRLLNGTHTLCCGLSFLAGIETVGEAMKNKSVSLFIKEIMKTEISPSIALKIDTVSKNIFIAKVLDRFRNPHIDHYWKNICLHYTSKMKTRCIPLLLNYYAKNNEAPVLFSLGFAAYLYYMKPVKKQGNLYYGVFNNEFYLIEDEMAGVFYDLWRSNPIPKVVKNILANYHVWGEDLTILEGFESYVTKCLESISEKGMELTMLEFFPIKTFEKAIKEK